MGRIIINVPPPPPYTQSAPHLHLAIRFVKNLLTYPSTNIIRVQSSISLQSFNPLPRVTTRRVICQKENHKISTPRDSGNSNPPTMKSLIVKVSHKLPFHTNNLLTFITIHTNHKHLPIDCKCYPPPPSTLPPYFSATIPAHHSRRHVKTSP